MSTQVEAGDDFSGKGGSPGNERARESEKKLRESESEKEWSTGSKTDKGGWNILKDAFRLNAARETKIARV